MNAKNTKQQILFLVLVALILLVGAALFLLTEREKQTEQAASEAAEGSISLAAVSADALEQIQIHYQGETLTLSYADGSWTLGNTASAWSLAGTPTMTFAPDLMDKLAANPLFTVRVR